MKLDPDVSAVIDAVLAGYLSDHQEMEERWLFEQTVFTAGSWRALLGLITAEESWTVLDLGTGFGGIALELAAQASSRVHGVDADESKLQVARHLADLLAEEEVFSGVLPSFDLGEAYSLPYGGEHFDLVIGRLVYQYLADPLAAGAELWRVVRPGGYVCLMDVDDQFSLVYPEVSDAFPRLHRAFVELAASKGQDRYVGRKLSTYLESSGFDVVTTLIWPQSLHAPSHPDGLARQFDVGRLMSARGEIVERGIMAPEEFDECLELYATEDLASQFTCSAQVVVMATRPTS